jgi:NAD(P)-dependent dehydrogenase (short-subunit alcohol dehydrogenase family)
MTTTSLLDLSKEFGGRRVVVTGGSRGIGAAIAQRLIDGGASVVVTARSATEDTPKDATFIPADLRSEPGANDFADKALAALGGVDIIVNNAGAARPFLPGSSAIPDEEWVDSLDINFLAAVRVTNALLGALSESESGVVLNVSSGGVAPLPAPLVHYGAAKAALNAYTLSLALELAPQRIRVNIVTPGPVISPGGDAIRDVFIDALGIPPEAFWQQVPLGRAGQPWEVAETVAYLASDRGAWVTGHNYFVDGGQAAK